MSSYRNQDPDRARAAEVVGGLLLGLVVCFVYNFIAVLGAMDSFEVQSTTTGMLIFGAPGLLGILLLAFPRTRRAGSGFVIGFASGLIVLSALCVAPLTGG